MIKLYQFRKHYSLCLHRVSSAAWQTRQIAQQLRALPEYDFPKIMSGAKMSVRCEIL